MLKRSAVNYLYDGTIEGLYCCVFYSFSHKEIPMDIYNYDNDQNSLYESIEIFYNKEHADRVYRGIVNTLSMKIHELVLQCFLSDLKSKELCILEFLHYRFKNGAAASAHLFSDCVLTVQKAAQRCRMEAHNYKGFVRFTQRGGVLVGEIHPHCRVLSLIMPHFKNRFINEHIMIVDKTHNEVMLASGGKGGIVPFDDIELKSVDEKEEAIADLWRCFFKTVSIEDRYNPRCQNTHLPKRYRSDMTEFTT